MSVQRWGQFFLDVSTQGEWSFGNKKKKRGTRDGWGMRGGKKGAGGNVSRNAGFVAKIGAQKEGHRGGIGFCPQERGGRVKVSEEGAQ